MKAHSYSCDRVRGPHSHWPHVDQEVFVTGGAPLIQGSSARGKLSGAAFSWSFANKTHNTPHDTGHTALGAAMPVAIKTLCWAKSLKNYLGQLLFL